MVSVYNAQWIFAARVKGLLPPAGRSEDKARHMADSREQPAPVNRHTLGGVTASESTVTTIDLSPCSGSDHRVRRLFGDPKVIGIYADASLNGHGLTRLFAVYRRCVIPGANPPSKSACGELSTFRTPTWLRFTSRSLRKSRKKSERDLENRTIQGQMSRFTVLTNTRRNLSIQIDTSQTASVRRAISSKLPERYFVGLPEPFQWLFTTFLREVWLTRIGFIVKAPSRSLFGGI